MFYRCSKTSAAANVGDVNDLVLSQDELYMHFRQCDYSISGYAQQRVYEKPVNDVDQLKQCLIEVLPQAVVDEETAW